MPAEGDELGAMLGNLWLCGRSYMPSAAAHIADVNKVIAGGSDDSSVFGREGTVPGTPGITGTVMGIVYPHWDALRDELQRALATSAENMYETADALIDVTNLYAEQDAAAAGEMRGRVDRYIDSGDYTIHDPADRPDVTPPH